MKRSNIRTFGYTCCGKMQFSKCSLKGIWSLKFSENYSWDLQAEAIYGTKKKSMQIKLKPISAKKRNLILLSKGQQKQKKEESSSNGKKITGALINIMTSCCCTFTLSFAFSEENKPAFPQSTRKQRPSLCIFRSCFTKYYES